MAGAGWQEESLLQSELALLTGTPLSPTASGARDYLFLKLGFWALESENWACTLPRLYTVVVWARPNNAREGLSAQAEHTVREVGQNLAGDILPGFRS